MNLVDRAVERPDGPFRRSGVSIVRYADDFIMMARTLKPKAIEHLKGMLARMKLTLNEEKTRLVDARTETFNFLGFTFKYARSQYGRGKRYLLITPSAKALNNVREAIREYVSENRHLGPQAFVKGLNAIVRGWTNYFRILGVSYPMEAFRKLQYYLVDKLYRFYRRKSQRRCKLANRGAFKVLVERYGLISPARIICR